MRRFVTTKVMRYIEKNIWKVLTGKDLLEIGWKIIWRGKEAQAAESAMDFNHKIGIVLKEICESNYWYRVLNAILTNFKKDIELQRLLNESFELKKIFSSIKIKTSLRKKDK